MADSRDSELVEGGSLAVEVSSSEPSPELVLSPESPDGFVHVESSRIDGDLDGSDNQELGSFRGDEDDMRVSEDAGKEDMFVDCPDELVGNVDSKEVVLAAESGENLTEKIHFRAGNGGNKDFVAGESVLREYKEEREVLSREISSLRSQLQALVNHQEGLLSETGVPLNELVNECLHIVQIACKERSQNEATMSELRSAVLAKNNEIEELNAKIAGFPLLDIETVTDRLLAYYGGVVDPQELVDDSIAGKLVFVERGTYMLAERYNMMLYEIDQLRQCFSEASLDLGSQDFGMFFASARGEVLELKRKELEFVEKISHYEDENRKVIQQLDDQKTVIERLNAELEQEKTRCSNVREKLTMAVSKGKSLVQHRDSLKQSLAEKTSELEKCMSELQEKSRALEAAELHKEELHKAESSVVLLQETLLQRNEALEKFEEMMSGSGIPEELLSMDVVQRCRWLIDEYGELKELTSEFHKVKDALSSIAIPEALSTSGLESQVHWVTESLDQVKSEFATVKEAAEKEIERLNASLSAELQMKGCLQTELDDQAQKYKEVVEKESDLSRERDRVVKMLLEGLGIALDDEGNNPHTSTDIVGLIERFIWTIKEQRNASFQSSNVNSELFEKLQGYLYVANQELMLCELVLEEEMSIRSQLNNISGELKIMSHELAAMKEEKESLQKHLERSEEKSALVREKLSMAVKKGKGLVQDREKLKLQLEEKDSEIENLRLQFQQKESELGEHKDRITGLSADVERISSLEMDLASAKQQRDQLEGFLLESNNMLQRVIGALDAIVLPADLVFGEPVEKVNCVVGYINECHTTKELMEKELASVREEVNTLSGKLVEAEATVQSLEDTLSDAEKTISLLTEEKTEIVIAKDKVEQELRKEREEASLRTGKFAEALLHAENSIKEIASEKESVLASRADTELELKQVRAEVTTQTMKLTEAHKTISSLEDALSMVQSNFDLLTGQYNESEVQRTNLETELKKFQEEAESQAGKLVEASATIKSLEDSLLKSENNFSVLESKKKSAEEEIFMLNSKLNAYMEESVGANRSFEDGSTELSGYLYDLQVLVNDNTLLSMLKSFEAKFDSLRNMDNVLEHIRDHFLGLGLEELQKRHIVEEDLRAASSISECLGNIFTLEKYNGGDVSADDGDHVSSLKKIVDAFQSRNKAIAEKIGRFSSFVDEFIAALLRKLQATRGEVVVVFEYIESLKQKVKTMEVCNEEQTSTIALIENDIATILSACTDASRELHFDAKNSLLEELDSLPEFEQLRHSFSPVIREIDEVNARNEGSRYSDVAEMLLLESRKVKALCKQFESTADVAVSTIVDMQNSLKEARSASEKAIEELELKQKLVSKLERDLETIQKSYEAMEIKLKERDEEVEALKNTCSELRILAQEYEAKEVELKDTEAEVQALRHSCSELKLMIEGHRVTEAKLKEKEEEVEALQNSCRELKLKGEDYHQAMEVELKEKEANVQALQHSCTELRLTVEDYQANEAKLMDEVETLKHACAELSHRIEEYQVKEVGLKEREAEVSSSMRGAPEDSLLSAFEVKALFEKIREIDFPIVDSEVGVSEPQDSTHINKLFYIIDNFSDLRHKTSSLAGEKEKLHSTLAKQKLETELLKKEIENLVRQNQATETMKNEQSQVIFRLEKMIDMLEGSSLASDQISSGDKGPLSALEKKVVSLVMEYEVSKSKAQDLASKLLGSQKIVDGLSARVKLLEDSLEAKDSQPEIVQPRSIFEVSSLPSDPEISEIEDVGKNTIPPVPLAAQMRTTRKGSTDHLALDIDLESSRLISNEEPDEDKGHVFKSLNTSGLVPRQGKMIADRVDGIWVSGGRMLMSRPRARIGVIAYCLLLHIWLLASIL